MLSIKALLAKPFAKRVEKAINKWASAPVQTQEKVFSDLINKAKNTAFGRDHDFGTIHSHADFVKRVPIRDYEALRLQVSES